LCRQNVGSTLIVSSAIAFFGSSLIFLYYDLIASPPEAISEGGAIETRAIRLPENSRFAAPEVNFFPQSTLKETSLAIAYTLQGNANSVNNLAYDADGRFLASGGKIRTVKTIGINLPVLGPTYLKS